MKTQYSSLRPLFHSAAATDNGSNEEKIEKRWKKIIPYKKLSSIKLKFYFYTNLAVNEEFLLLLSQLGVSIILLLKDSPNSAE